MASNTEIPTGERSPTIPSADDAFDLLSDPRRRHALYYLFESDGSVELTALAEHVAASVAGSSDRISAEDVETTCTSLHHSHLPRLEDAGVIERDADESTVALSRRAEAFESVLSLAARHDSRR